MNPRVDVVTVIAPRDGSWSSYLPLLDLQRRTAEKFGHTHLVMHDCDPIEEAELQRGHEYQLIRAVMQKSLMHAILEGQIAYINQWSGEHPAVLVDVDVLVARDLREVFDGTWDLGLTNRTHDRAPINNGAMYLAPGSKQFALDFFSYALSICKEHWGGDQEAISEAAAPVPHERCVVKRPGGRIGYISMLMHNCVAKLPGSRHKCNPFVVHFKGKQAKAWMKTYAECFIL